MKRSEATRVALTAALGVGAGLITALVTNVLIGAYPGHFLAVWGVATRFVLAIGMPIAAFQVIFGVAGTAIGWILFLVIGNPASGGSSAPELLPGFWRTLSQLLPPGAGVTSLRDVVYFNGHGSTHALIVLALYAVLGGAVALIAYKLRTRGGVATGATKTGRVFP
jgi:ABC-type polysaccharide/polyol phosphate export permease